MTDSNSYLKEIIRAHNLVGFEDVFWNLGQVLAWAETRNPFPVDALSDSTPGLARRDHSFPPGLPHFATEIAAQNCEENGVAKTKSPFRSLDDVRIAVLRSFQSGEMPASGQRRGSSGREPITPLEWADLTIDDNATEEMTVRHRDGYDAAWRDVRVRRQDVLSAFPTLRVQSSEKPNRIAISIPEAYYHLERTVLVLAKELDQSVWQTGKMSADEIVAYEGLGHTTHYDGLKPVLDQIGNNRRDREGNLPDSTMAERLASYERCQKIVREALIAGELKSCLQMDTGERVERSPEDWHKGGALNGFDDGLVWLEGEDSSAATSGWASVLIDKDSFSDWYYSGTGPMADVEAKEKDKGGRPPEYDWDAVKAYALGLVQEHGAPGRGNRRLPSKSQLVEAVLDEWSRKYDQQLADSTVRRHVGRWLSEL